MSGLDLAGKRVVVTGAAGGLGRAFVQAFAREGATVMAADINETAAAETARLVHEAGGQARSERVDVTDAASTRALAEAALETMGGIDVLVNNAAIYAGL